MSDAAKLAMKKLVTLCIFLFENTASKIKILPATDKMETE